MQQLQAWLGFRSTSLVFDSDVHGWSRSEFRQRVLGRNNLVVVELSECGDVFGFFIDLPLEQTNVWCPINRLEVFSLARGGHVGELRHIRQSTTGYNGRLGVNLWDFKFMFTTYLFGIEDDTRQGCWVSSTPHEWFDGFDFDDFFTEIWFHHQRCLVLKVEMNE